MKNSRRSKSPVGFGLKFPKLDFSRTRKRLLEKRKAEQRLERMSLGDLYDFVESREQKRLIKSFADADPIAEAKATYLAQAKAIVAAEFSAAAPATRGNPKRRHRKVPVVLRNRKA